SLFAYVGLIHQDDASFLENATVAVIGAINGGIELVVAADGHHHQPMLIEIDLRRFGDIEMRFPVRGGEPAFARSVRQIETTAFAHTQIVSIESWDGFPDVVPDRIIVPQVAVPVDTGCAGSKRGFGKPADDGRFAEQLVGNGCQNAFRRLDDAHGILAGDELFEAAGKIAVATRKTRQDKSFLSMNEVAAVQLGGDMDREAAASKRFGG